jgi:hypothetical protein
MQQCHPGSRILRRGTALDAPSGRIGKQHHCQGKGEAGQERLATYVAVGQAVPQVTPDDEHDHFGREPEPPNLVASSGVGGQRASSLKSASILPTVNATEPSQLLPRTTRTRNARTTTTIISEGNRHPTYAGFDGGQR